MPHYRIDANGSQHRRKENGSWRVYGKGDTIDLSTEQYNSGRYAHLRLHHVSSDEVAALEKQKQAESEAAAAALQTEADEAAKQAAAAQTEQQRLADEAAAEKDRLAAEEAALNHPNKEKIDKVDELLKKAEDATTAATFKTVRDEVVESDLVTLEDGDKKADVVRKLTEKRAELAAPVQ